MLSVFHVLTPPTQAKRDANHQEAMEKAGLIAPLRESIELAHDYYEQHDYQAVIDTLEKPIEVKFFMATLGHSISETLTLSLGYRSKDGVH